MSAFSIYEYHTATLDAGFDVNGKDVFEALHPEHCGTALCRGMGFWVVFRPWLSVLAPAGWGDVGGTVSIGCFQRVADISLIG